MTDMSNSVTKASKSFAFDNIIDEQRDMLKETVEEYPAITISLADKLLRMLGVLKFKDMDEASVELGYEDDFDSLIDGYVRCGDTDYWKEIMIKDDMMKLDRVTIKASFVDCEPQDVIRYVLACAGIEDYVLSDEHYGKKDLFVIDRKSGINTIAEVNSSWGIKNPFFFQKKVFYWGTKEEQKNSLRT